VRIRQQHRGKQYIARQCVPVSLLAFLLCSSSFACSSLTMDAKVPTSFVMQVLDFRGHPLKSIEFQLLQGSTLARSFVTDTTGHITVNGLPPGKYTFKRTDLKYPLLAVNLDVSDSNEARKTPLILSWPREHVYTRSLAGTLHFFKTEPEPRPVQQQGDAPLIALTKIIKGAVAGVHLELFLAGASKKIAETITTENGDFDFRVTNPGLYEMRFRFDNEDRSKLLELDSDSTSQSNLDLWVNSGGFVANGFINVMRGCD
jgi:hypothetical protein